MSLGQDTEFFVYNVAEGHVVPAHTIGIAKKKVLCDWHGSYFRDGYAVEFNAPPSTCRAGLWENLAKAMQKFRGLDDNRYGQKSLSAIPSGMVLITDPAMDIDLEELKSAPADLHVLGCNPTLDAYKMEEKCINTNPLELPFRTTGAHLHFSFPPGTFYSKSDLAILTRYLDLTIGLPFTVIYGDDKEFRRRTLYGTAGEFREQKYEGGYQGLEYRVLSSRLYHHPGIFGLFAGIFKYLLSKPQVLLDAGWNEALSAPLQKAINTGVGAAELLEEFSKFLGTFPSFYDRDGMSGIGYIPKDWGNAILKLRKMRLSNGILDRFQMWEGQTQAHYGWSEYNDHSKTAGLTVERSSTVSHEPLIKEEPWLL